MSALSFDDAPVAVRDDLVAATRRAWARLARPGAWWSGAERVAIAREVRAARECALCRDRRGALSPEAVQGRHDGPGSLPPPAVEAVHRIASDPGRLSRAWFERTRAAGLADAPYVELVGVVVTVVCVDALCRGLGVPPRALPTPESGEPSRARPAAARDEGAWVPMLPLGAARGAEADLWRGRAPNVLRALSLVPDEVRTLKDHSAACYLPAEQVADPTALPPRALDRAQMELVAGRVSALRECFY